MSCVHILAVKFRAGFAESAKASLPTAPVCRKCRSADVTLSGRRLNKSGAVRRYRCMTCGAYFSGVEGFHRRRSDPDMIAKALDLYFRGTSLRQVSEHFAQAYGLKISHVAIYRWIVHYSKVAAQWLDAQGAKVGDKWSVDERVINVDGEHRYLWNVMDQETRFLLATAVSEARSFSETRVPFEKAKAATEVRPTEIRSDGMNAYPWAVKVEFGEGIHRRVPSIRAKDSNNRIERMHGSQKDRTKTMRAYDNDRGAEALSEGWRVHYDMVKTHLALGTTPGVAAGLPELGGFRWRAILDLAASRNVTPVDGDVGPDA
ncbi:MAG: IS6 family transposase [Thermoplasmata archaeon]